MAWGGGFGWGLRGIRKFFSVLPYCSSFALLSLTACHRSQGAVSSVSVREEIEPQPPVIGPATVTVSLADGEGHSLSHAGVRVEGDMFAMAGDWVLLLHVKLAGGETVEREIDVKGVRAK
jgi:hypothetical protein